MQTFADRRVLVVDDEKNVALLLQRSLMRLEPHLEVFTAHSGAQAFELLQGGAFDLIVTDYQMPQTNGLDLIRAVRERHPHTKIILITAYPSARIAQELERLAVEGYLVKPFSIRRLRELVCQTLAL
jgi:CheY-like chemotaxis protein